MRPRASKQAKQKQKARSTRHIINGLIQLEKRVWRTAQEKDAEGFSELVPPDAIMIFQSGIVRQPEYLATMNVRTIARYKLEHIKGFMPNATTAILYYEAVRIGDEGGKSFPQGAVLESTTWIKRSGRWVAVLNQETPIARHTS